MKEGYYGKLEIIRRKTTRIHILCLFRWVNLSLLTASRSESKIENLLKIRSIKNTSDRFYLSDILDGCALLFAEILSLDPSVFFSSLKNTKSVTWKKQYGVIFPLSFDSLFYYAREDIVKGLVDGTCLSKETFECLVTWLLW